jgi:hypothetical protein
MQLNKSLHYLFASILWLITFFVYRMTMAPTIGFIDSGELSTVALSLGIAHPTGYPLFTLLARTFSLLPIASEQIVRLNIFSAVVTSLSVVIFFFLVLELSAQTREERNRWELLTAASISSMFIGFSKTFWFQGLAIEVYSLHLLLILSALLLFVKAVRSGSSHHWLLFAFVVGLAFTNHLTTILLAPAMLYWFFSEHGIGKSAFKKIGLLAVPFAAGLSVYLTCRYARDNSRCSVGETRNQQNVSGGTSQENNSASSCSPHPKQPAGSSHIFLTTLPLSSSFPF